MSALRKVFDLIMKCPHCNHDLNIGKLLSSVRSERKSEASRRNGAKNKGGLVKAGSCESLIKQAAKLYSNNRYNSYEGNVRRVMCQHFSGCSNEGFQAKGRTVYLCKEHG